MAIKWSQFPWQPFSDIFKHAFKHFLTTSFSKFQHIFWQFLDNLFRQVPQHLFHHFWFGLCRWHWPYNASNTWEYAGKEQTRTHRQADSNRPMQAYPWQLAGPRLSVGLQTGPVNQHRARPYGWKWVLGKQPYVHLTGNLFLRNATPAFKQVQKI